MENILTKIKHRMNVDPKPYYNRLSWKIVVPRLLYKLAVALVNLAFYIFKAFLATVLSVIIMERIINDRAPFELIVSLFYTPNISNRFLGFCSGKVPNPKATSSIVFSKSIIIQ